MLGVNYKEVNVIQCLRYQSNSTMLILSIIDAGFSDEMLELILFAVEDLRKSLKDQGSNLMIRFGSAENVIRELVKEVITYWFAYFDILLARYEENIKHSSTHFVTFNTAD